MALIIYKENGVGYDVSLPLKEPLLRAAIAQIVSIRADGDELKKIRNQYKNVNLHYESMSSDVDITAFSIPMKEKAKHMIWWGDIARTILSNL